MRLKTKTIKDIVVYFLALFMLVIIIFPIYIMFISSLKPVNEVFDLRLVPKTFTVNNYITVFKEANFLIYLKNSIIVASTVTVFAIVFHSMAGYVLARLNIPGREIIFIYILSTLMIPFAVIMIPLFLIVRSIGMVNSLWGMIVPAIFNAYGIFLFRQFYLGIPSDLEDAALIDGCSYFGIYLRVIIPLSKPIAVALGSAIFLANWNSYLWPLIIAQRKSLWVIQLGIANFRGEYLTEWNLILAASCIAALPTMVFFAFFQKYLVEGIKMSGLKA